jgi:hypothetical protein
MNQKLGLLIWMVSCQLLCHGVERVSRCAANDVAVWHKNGFVISPIVNRIVNPGISSRVELLMTELENEPVMQKKGYGKS